MASLESWTAATARSVASWTAASHTTVEASHMAASREGDNNGWQTSLRRQWHGRHGCWTAATHDGGHILVARRKDHGGDAVAMCRRRGRQVEATPDVRILEVMAATCPRLQGSVDGK